MSWQALVLIHALFSALQALQFRAIARARPARKAALAVNAIAFSSLYVSSVIVSPLLGRASLGEFIDDWQMFAAIGGLFVVAVYFTYNAMVHLDSAVASVLGSSSALFVLILANFFYGESLTPQQIVGIAILLPCLWYVLLLAKRGAKFWDFRNQSWVKGAVFMLTSSVLFAIGHIIEKDVLQRSSTATYVVYGWLLQLAFAWGLYLLLGRQAKKVFRSKKIVRSALQLGVFRATSGIFFILALSKSGNVSLVTVVGNFRIVVVAVLAGWLLNERHFYYKKLIAAAISVVALSIVLWS